MARVGMYVQPWVECPDCRYRMLPWRHFREQVNVAELSSTEPDTRDGRSGTARLRAATLSLWARLLTAPPKARRRRARLRALNTRLGPDAERLVCPNCLHLGPG